MTSASTSSLALAVIWIVFSFFPTTFGSNTVVVRSQQMLNRLIGSDITLELGANIPLYQMSPSSNNSGIFISDVVNLTLDGNGYDINGQGMLRCFWIRASIVSIEQLHIRSCTASGNLETFGGGMVLVSTVLLMHNVTLSDCKLSDSGQQQLDQFYFMGGGAIFATAFSVLRMTNSSIMENSAVGTGKGGGLSITNGSTLELKSTYIIQNVAGNVGGFGGGVYSVNSNVDFSHCTFFHNEAALSCSTDLAARGGGFYSVDSTITISDTNVLQNYGVINGAECHYGGGSFNDGGTITIVRSEYVNNQALNRGGGGIYSQAGSMVIIDSTFKGNSVGGYSNDGPNGWGGAVVWVAAADSTDGLYIYSTTFSGNTGGAQGGALYIYMLQAASSENVNEVVISDVHFDSNSAKAGNDILMVMLEPSVDYFPNFDFSCVPGCDEYGVFMPDGICSSKTTPDCLAMIGSTNYPDCETYFSKPCYSSCASASTDCMSCPQNQYNPNLPSNNEVCTMCPNGTVIDDSTTPSLHVSVNQCVFCSPGTELLSESSECTPCLTGHYKNVSSADQCAICPENHYTCSTGSTLCLPCQPGTYADETHSYCTQCGRGQYVNGSTCLNCPSGKYSPAATDSCIDVPPGFSTVGKNSGADTVAACNGGTYSEGSAVNCSVCPQGRFSKVESSSCTICDAGTYSDDAASVCTSCSVGRYSSTSGLSTCITCPAGKFSSAGASECTDCAAGLYNPQIEQAYCLACSNDKGPEYTSYIGASECAACVGSGSSKEKTGYYYDRISDPSSPKCVACSNGMLCQESYQELETIKLKEGWYRFSKSSSTVYACLADGACNAPAQSPENATSQTGNAICSAGYKGPLCSLCQNKYGYHATTGTCEKCSSKHYAKTLGLFLVVAVVIGSLIWGYIKYQKKIIEKLNWSDEKQLELNIMFAHFRVFLITIQTGILINENQEAAGGKSPPASLAQFQNVFAFLNLSLTFLPFGCFFRSTDFFTWVIVQSVGLILFCSLFAFLHWRSSGQNTWYASTAVQVMKLLLPTVTLTLCRTFRCEYFDDKSFYLLLEDMSIDCRSAYYKYQMIPFAVTMIIILPVGVTLSSIVSLFHAKENGKLKRHNLRGTTTRSDDETNIKSESNDYVMLKDFKTKCADNDSDEDDKDPLYTLYCDVKERHWYAEVMDMVRRLLLTCFPIIFTKYGSVIVFSLAIALLALVYQQEVQPYFRESVNKVKMMESYQNILFIIALLIQNSDMFSSSVMYETAGAALVSTNLLMLLIIFFLRKVEQVDKDKDEKIEELERLVSELQN